MEEIKRIVFSKTVEQDELAPGIMTDQERRALHGIIDDAEKSIAMLQSVKRRAILLLNPQQSTKPISIRHPVTGKAHLIHSRQGSAGKSSDPERETHLPR